MAEAVQSQSLHLKSDDEDSDGWDEMETSGEQTTCLFCPLQFHTIAVALDHCRTKHNFDLLVLKEKHKMDCYSYIKMINYIRSQKPEAQEIMDAPGTVWEDERYLKPGEIEPWLMYDFDDLESAPFTPYSDCHEKDTISNLNVSDLHKIINELNLQINHQNLLIETYERDLKKMKEVTQNIINIDDNSVKNNVTGDSYIGESSDYFNSYSHFGIHYDMLNDKVRTDSYRDAIINNGDLFKDKVVLDVGCGTGILSMFSAKAGAKKVIGVDQSEVVYKAMDIVRENGLTDTVQLIKGQLEKTNLPSEKVDIIVSEWMGYFLLFEGMLDTVIYARDRFLKEGGQILPNRCSIKLVGVSDEEKYRNVVNFWDNVYGFSMKCMKPEILREATVDTVPEDKIITNEVTVADLDLMTCTTSSCNFKHNFTLTPLKDGILTALVGYFDTFFELPNPVYFSTGPHVQRTHWQQTVFYLQDMVDLKKGESIKCSISCSRLRKNVRGLFITLIIGDCEYKYVIE